MNSTWKHYFSQLEKRIEFFVSIFVLIVILTFFVFFLTYNESRPGFVFNDPVLQLFQPIAISELIFSVTYFFGILGLIISFRVPAFFVSMIQAYSIMTLFRIVCMYLVPLEAPDSIIPLNDSFLQTYFYSGRENLKDLFFSGHTATIFLFAFAFKENMLKWIFAIAACLVGVLVILQHIHFSIDVLAAPIFSFAAVRLQKKIRFFPKI